MHSTPIISSIIGKDDVCQCRAAIGVVHSTTIFICEIIGCISIANYETIQDGRCIHPIVGYYMITFSTTIISTQNGKIYLPIS